MPGEAERSEKDYSVKGEAKQKPVIVVFVRYYLPGFKSGGPVRSIANMVSLLGGEFDFRVVTMDRDFMDAGPYPDVIPDRWMEAGKAQVWYFGGRFSSFRKLAHSLNGVGKYTLYLNSLFDPLYSILPLAATLIKLIRPRRTVIAPRGELSPGALELKSLRKAFYLRVSGLLGIYEGVHWHASTTLEKADIAKAHIPSLKSRSGRLAAVWGEKRIRIAGNIFVASDLVEFTVDGPNYNTSNTLVFLSRITRKKNLDFALRVLALCKSPVRFVIYGTVEEPGYWAECERMIAELPAHIEVSFQGTLRPDQVPGALKACSLFFFPTRGENYGHVIAEALAAGLPLLLSDQTPWNDIEQNGAGWVRPLVSHQPFADKIDAFLALDGAARNALSNSVNAYAREHLWKSADIADNQNLFSPDSVDRGKHAAAPERRVTVENLTLSVPDGRRVGG